MKWLVKSALYNLFNIRIVLRIWEIQHPSHLLAHVRFWKFPGDLEKWFASLVNQSRKTFLMGINLSASKITSYFPITRKLVWNEYYKIESFTFLMYTQDVAVYCVNYCVANYFVNLLCCYISVNHKNYVTS